MAISCEWAASSSPALPVCDVIVVPPSTSSGYGDEAEASLESLVRNAGRPVRVNCMHAQGAPPTKRMLEILQTAGERARVIDYGGWAQPWMLARQALRCAVKDREPYHVMVCSADVVFGDRWADELLAGFRIPGVGCVIPKTVNLVKQETSVGDPSLQMLAEFRKLFNSYGPGWGCSLAINGTVIVAGKADVVLSGMDRSGDGMVTDMPMRILGNGAQVALVDGGKADVLFTKGTDAVYSRRVWIPENAGGSSGDVKLDSEIEKALRILKRMAYENMGARA